MYQVSIFTVLWKLTDLFDSTGSCTPADLDFQVGQSDVLDIDFVSATVAIIAQKSEVCFDSCLGFPAQKIKNNFGEPILYKMNG